MQHHTPYFWYVFYAVLKCQHRQTSQSDMSQPSTALQAQLAFPTVNFARVCDESNRLDLVVSIAWFSCQLGIGVFLP